MGIGCRKRDDQRSGSERYLKEDGRTTCKVRMHPNANGRTAPTNDSEGGTFRGSHSKGQITIPCKPKPRSLKKFKSREAKQRRTRRKLPRRRKPTGEGVQLQLQQQLSRQPQLPRWTME